MHLILTTLAEMAHFIIKSKKGSLFHINLAFIYMTCFILSKAGKRGILIKESSCVADLPLPMTESMAMLNYQ